MPVSYTHLDVYKRQNLRRPEETVQKTLWKYPYTHFWEIHGVSMGNGSRSKDIWEWLRYLGSILLLESGTDVYKRQGKYDAKKNNLYVVGNAFKHASSWGERNFI